MTTLILPIPKPVATQAPATRHPLFEATRVMAAHAIVWLHTPRLAELAPTTAVGRFAVPFFTAAATFWVYQSAARSRHRAVASYAYSRFLRLYVPFAAWSVIYLGFKAVKHWMSPDQPNDFPGWSVLLSGGFYHLWFLPFALTVTVIAFMLVRFVFDNPRREANLAMISAAAGMAAIVAPMPSVLAHMGPVVEYWWMAVPAACWGLSLAALYRHGRSDWFGQSTTTWCALGIAAVATLYTAMAGRSMAAENLAGLAMLVFALGAWHGPWVHKLAVLGPLAYGIYLSHLLFIKTCEAVANKFNWPVSWQLDLLTFVIAAVGSTALAWWLSQHKQTRWLVA